MYAIAVSSFARRHPSGRLLEHSYRPTLYRAHQTEQGHWIWKVVKKGKAVDAWLWGSSGVGRKAVDRFAFENGCTRVLDYDGGIGNKRITA